MNNVTHVITTISRGGAEKQLVTLAHEQIRNGWRVTVIYLKDKPELIEEFRVIGVEVISECASKSVIKQIFWLRNHFSNHKCVIHAHLPRAELLTAIAASKNSFVFTRHNSESFFPGAPRIISSYLSRFVTKRAKSGIAISKAVELFVKSKKEISKNCEISIVHYGYGSTEISLELPQLTRTDLNLSENDFIFGTIGRIVPQKDYPTLLKAFSINYKGKREYKLLIIGDGYLKQEMQDLASKLKISSNVVWLGRTDRINEILKLMNCFILASSYEGFGLVLLEAMSAEVPIVATKNSAIPEVLGANYPFLSETGDALDLARNMSRVVSLNSEDLSNLLALESTQLESFNPAIMYRRILRVYLKI